MRDFTFLEPHTVAEASRMMSHHGDEARLFAGGTALLLAMRHRLIAPSYVVYLGGVPGLSHIAYDEHTGLRIGALARHCDLANNATVNARYPMLAAMADRVANPQVRNMGTVGGNLCYGDPATDPPACLMALGAQVVARDASGERTIELDQFFVDYYETALRQDEVVTEIRVPSPPMHAVGAYTRFLKTPAEHRPLVSVAVTAEHRAGTCRNVRIAIGASVPIPARARRAEAFLEGKTPTAEILAQAADLAAADIAPVDDFRGAADYRRDMVRAMVRRTAAAAFTIPLD